jgi:hypothetical protein
MAHKTEDISKCYKENDDKGTSAYCGDNPLPVFGIAPVPSSIMPDTVSLMLKGRS